LVVYFEYHYKKETIMITKFETPNVKTIYHDHLPLIIILDGSFPSSNNNKITKQINKEINNLFKQLKKKNGHYLDYLDVSFIVTSTLNSIATPFHFATNVKLPKFDTKLSDPDTPSGLFSAVEHLKYYSTYLLENNASLSELAFVVLICKKAEGPNKEISDLAAHAFQTLPLDGLLYYMAYSYDENPISSLASFVPPSRLYSCADFSLGDFFATLQKALLEKLPTMNIKAEITKP
jgi:hypothetical protein